VADLERISITIEPELLVQLDAQLAAHGHQNRSEAIRDLVRAHLLTFVPADTRVAGSLTLVYDHRQRALSDRLVEAAHDHHDIVLSTLHVHLDHDTCMELSALRGARHELEHYAAHLLGMKGVLHGSLVISCACG
jgi:CopG family transcriptional regulator, nickel-responsive regulator